MISFSIQFEYQTQKIAEFQLCYFCVDKLTYLVNIIDKGGEKMPDLVKMLTDGGVTIAIIAFFMYRDIKFMNTLQATLTSLVDAVNELKKLGGSDDGK